MKSNEAEILQVINQKIESIPVYESKSNYNIFRVLEVEHKEVIMCRFLADLLDPNGFHNQGVLFLKTFCENVIGIKNQPDSILEKTEVIKEYKIDADESDRRIDIVISNSINFIPIEVKIFAKDQKNQCLDYYEFAEKQNRGRGTVTKIVYLTRFGTMPSDYSRCNLSDDKIIRISWEKHIIPWLENIRDSLVDEQKVILNQFIDAVHDIAYGRDTQIMDKTKEELIKSAANIRAGLAIEKSMKAAKLEIMKAMFEEFKNQMVDICTKYNLEYENRASFGLYDGEGQDRFFDCYSTYPGLNYKVKNVNFQNKDMEMWFRIEVEQNLFAGFVLYDFSLKRDDNKESDDNIGNMVPEITETIKRDISTYLDSSIYSNSVNWWITWVYSNGKTKESSKYDDVPNFKSMNECAINMADENYRKEYVRTAIKTFENVLLSKLKK